MFIKRMKLICKTQGRGGAKGDLRSQHDPPGPGPRAGKALQATPGQLSSPLPPPPPDLPGAGQCAAETHRLGRDGCHSTAPPPLGFRSSEVCSAAAWITHTWNALESC